MPACRPCSEIKEQRVMTWPRLRRIVSGGIALGMTWMIVATAGTKPVTLPWIPSIRPFSSGQVYAPQGFERYAYAPSAIRSGAQLDLWTCHNAVAGQIQDHIWFTQYQGKRKVLSESVLAGSPGQWDAVNICDPSVIALDTKMAGAHYRYAMFFTGNGVHASRDNQIGVAVSTTLDGPWTLDPQPVVAFRGEPGFWGVGQPSAVTVDRRTGRALLFYTEGNATETEGVVRTMKLSSLQHPQLGAPTPLSNNGLTGADGSPDYLNNFDVALDRQKHRFYIVREQHPYPLTNPDYISTSVQVDWAPESAIWSGDFSWHVLGNITPALTGHPRNDNAGFVRTLTGDVPARSALTVLVTTSCADCAAPLWTYKVWKVVAKLSG